jgi:hypothetical protein
VRSTLQLTTDFGSPTLQLTSVTMALSASPALVCSLVGLQGPSSLALAGASFGWDGCSFRDSALTITGVGSDRPSHAGQHGDRFDVQRPNDCLNDALVRL